MSVADYNTNPDNNLAISGINIAEGCPPSTINNAIRQLMADAKTEHDDVAQNLGDVIASRASASDFGLCKVDNETIKATNGVISVIRTAILESVFPVGSIYTTTNSTNPATLFGFGTWEQIQGRMILGASSSYAVNSTGGEATHKLTVNETPAHTHSRGTMEINGNFSGFNFFRTTTSTTTYSGALSAHAAAGGQGGGGPVNCWERLTFKGSDGWSGSTSSVGGNAAHNNMPPYYAAYIWRRTN